MLIINILNAHPRSIRHANIARNSCSSTLDLGLPGTRRWWRCQLRHACSVVGLAIRPRFGGLRVGIHIEAQELLLVAVCTLRSGMITVDLVFTTGFTAQGIAMATRMMMVRLRGASGRGVTSDPLGWPQPLRNAGTDTLRGHCG